jgi:hypothetical protein
MRRRALGLLLLLAAACRPGRPAPPPVSATARGPVVKIGVAWVASEVAIGVEQVGAVLAVQIVEASGARRVVKVGTWWRAQQGAVEVVRPAAGGAALFVTEARWGVAEEPHDGPRFEVIRDAGGDVVVRGRGAAGPWRELARVPLSPATEVELLDGNGGE